MRNSPIRYFIVIVASSIGLFSVLIGLVFLIAGAQAYLGPDFSDTPPFAQILLAVGFLGFPVGVTLMVKARSSFMRGFEKYGLPDPPIRSFLISALGVVSLVSALAAFVIAAVMF